MKNSGFYYLLFLKEKSSRDNKPGPCLPVHSIWFYIISGIKDVSER